MLDLGDIPAGFAALDALAKEAPVEVIAAGTVQPGRYLLLFGGEVEATERAWKKATHAAAGSVVDEVLLPWCEERIVPAIQDDAVRWPCPGDTLGVVHNATPPTLIRCVDAALKGAYVDLVQFRITAGLGGRAVATFWGETHDVEAALELSAETSRRGRNHEYSARIIRNADPEVARSMEGGWRFFKEWRG